MDTLLGCCSQQTIVQKLLKFLLEVRKHDPGIRAFSAKKIIYFCQLKIC